VGCGEKSTPEQKVSRGSCKEYHGECVVCVGKQAVEMFVVEEAMNLSERAGGVAGKVDG
jgi:hypothetical protein